MLTGVVLTKNEEARIGECLDSLSFCDELIVIDDYSQDKTVAIAEKKKAKVFQRHLRDDFSSQRNFALTKAKKGWVFFVDADEKVSVRLQKEIQKVIQSVTFSGYYLKRQDIFLGKPLHFGETAKVNFLRLGQRDAGFWQGDVHEVWQINGSKGKIFNPLVHFSHPNLTGFLEKINFYSTLRAQSLFEERKTSGLRDIILYPVAKFIQDYFFFLGFLDGMPGLIMALMMSWHSFLSRGKLYLLWQKGPPEYHG